MGEYIVEVKEAAFSYKSHTNEDIAVQALENINIEIEQGQFVVIIGRNGSGKSTFARLLNALLLPNTGTVYINGMDTRDENKIWEIRRTAGMVFQNPENQIVGTIVEEDIAFGPENLGVPSADISKRVDEALKLVDISKFKKHAPHLLSGGQKQRVAIAGILAMKPECIILDEATAMLDPIGRKEVMGVIRKLNKGEKITVIHITHHMDEAVGADRVIVIDRGKVVMDGIPKDIFSKVTEIKNLGMDVPQVTELIYELNEAGYSLPVGILDVDEAFKYILEMISWRK